MQLIIIYKNFEFSYIKIKSTIMKKNIFLLLAVCSFALTAFSQSDKYILAMGKNLSQFDSAKTTDDFVKLANNFERIGDAEKTEWTAYYFAGLALSSAGWIPSTTINKDDNSGKIIILMDKAELLAPNDTAKSEIYTIRNMAYTQQMIVDPQNRYMTYGKQAKDALQKAATLYPNNPRVYYLQGMSLFNTPPQFGGGKDKAKLVFEKAIALYKIEHPLPLYPNWGQKQAGYQLTLCQ
jgi:hypothetical protein